MGQPYDSSTAKRSDASEGNQGLKLSAYAYFLLTLMVSNVPQHVTLSSYSAVLIPFAEPSSKKNCHSYWSCISFGIYRDERLGTSLHPKHICRTALPTSSGCGFSISLLLALLLLPLITTSSSAPTPSSVLIEMVRVRPVRVL